MAMEWEEGPYSHVMYRGLCPDSGFRQLCHSRPRPRHRPPAALSKPLPLPILRPIAWTRKSSASAISARNSCCPPWRRPGGDLQTQVREEVSFTAGRVIVKGKTVARGQAKRADVLLFYRPNIPLALIENKDNNHAVGDGMQQGLDYGGTLDVPYVYSSNGDGFLEHDRHRTTTTTAAARRRATTRLNRHQPHGGGHRQGPDRILLVMATGTGKTYTAFQIIWRLWKAGSEESASCSWPTATSWSTRPNNDFKPFGIERR
jgi:type I restriction enzyme R subunit